MLTGLLRDVQASLYWIARNRSYSFFTWLCLSLGIGACSAIFTVTDAFLVRPLPFMAPQQLMSVWMTVGDGSDTNRYFVDAANFTELFTSQEALQEEPVVLISETLWKLEYGGDPGVVGQTVRLSGREYVLAGVIPAGLAFPDQIQAWLPITRAVGARGHPGRGTGGVQLDRRVFAGLEPLIQP